MAYQVISGQLLDTRAVDRASDWLLANLGTVSMVRSEITRVICVIRKRVQGEFDLESLNMISDQNCTTRSFNTICYIHFEVA